MTEHHRFDYRAEGNISRQRAWRNYVTNPQSLHPILKYDEHEENKYDQMAFPIRRTIEFLRFTEKGREIVWQFDIEVNCLLESIWSRFIQDGHWFIITDAGPGESIFHVELHKEKFTEYRLPRCLDAHYTTYTILDSTIYFAREMQTEPSLDNNILEENSKSEKMSNSVLVFGHFVGQNYDVCKWKVPEDSLKLMTLHHLFFVEGEAFLQEKNFRMGIDGLVHVALSQTEVYTISIRDMMEQTIKCEKRTIKDSQSCITYTLPVINLGKIISSLAVYE